MKDHHFLPNQGTEEGAGNTLFPLRPDLKEAIPERLGIGETERRAILLDHLRDVEEVGQDARREGEGFCFYLLAEKCYVPFYGILLSFMITWSRKFEEKGSIENKRRKVVKKIEGGFNSEVQQLAVAWYSSLLSQRIPRAVNDIPILFADGG